MSFNPSPSPSPTPSKDTLTQHPAPAVPVRTSWRGPSCPCRCRSRWHPVSCLSDQARPVNTRTSVAAGHSGFVSAFYPNLSIRVSHQLESPIAHMVPRCSAHAHQRLQACTWQLRTHCCMDARTSTVLQITSCSPCHLAAYSISDVTVSGQCCMVPFMVRSRCRCTGTVVWCCMEGLQCKCKGAGFSGQKGRMRKSSGSRKAGARALRPCRLRRAAAGSAIQRSQLCNLLPAGTLDECQSSLAGEWERRFAAAMLARYLLCQRCCY